MCFASKNYWLVLILGLGLVSLSAAQTTTAGADKTLYSSKAPIIAYLSGKVFVNDQPASIGQTIGNQSTIRTDKKSSAEIVFNNKNVINMRAETILVLNLDQLDRGIEVKRGAIAAVLKQLDTGIGGA
jgi:hypothetical protein